MQTLRKSCKLFFTDRERETCVCQVDSHLEHTQLTVSKQTQLKRAKDRHDNARAGQDESDTGTQTARPNVRGQESRVEWSHTGCRRFY